MRSFYSLGGINPEVDCARRVGALSCLSDTDFDVCHVQTCCETKFRALLTTWRLASLYVLSITSASLRQTIS